MKHLILFTIAFFLLSGLSAEDGSRLWLRNDTDANAQVTSNKKSATIDIAIREIRTQWKGAPVKLNVVKNKNTRSIGDEGYTITGNKQSGIDISSFSEKGLLYGAYHLLRLQLTGEDTGEFNVSENPAFDIRMLNHWDNLNRTVERGYAGQSLWNWDELPNILSPRYEAYARANASIGINGTVINNVNANPKILSEEYLIKVKALADVFRPYNLKIYLAVNFSSPKELDGLPNSDPMNSDVKQWWNNKVKEIYKLIPDFGGFLVKANSEGLPGPQDYGRTHADGANMLADALKPFGGIVMWRAFVYNPSNEDRAKQAYQEFVPFDGEFRDNVIIQIKNGPIDFQPREPFSPLFGALRKTPEMLEFQITQEYLGFSNHLVYLAPLFKETLDSDTYADGAGSTIAKITDGTLRPTKQTAISGVANIGDDVNWCGHQFAQSNWYAFGRLAWNHQLTSEEIAEEWLKMTFTNHLDFIEPVKSMMLESREACVNYMMPLGLHHIFAWGHHYGPEPWCDIPNARPDWLPKYYHNAGENGIGFDRTEQGSNAVSQYFSPLNEIYNDPLRCPEELILWFHNLPWNYKMKNGNTLWDELCYKYDSGVMQVREFQKTWDKVEHYIDNERFQHVQSRLKIQSRDAVWWKDACLLYFQTYSQKPIPYDIERPVSELEQLKQFSLRISNYENAPR